MVGRAGDLELVEDPDPLLRERQGELLLAGDGDERRRLETAAGRPELLHGPGQALQRRCFEEPAKRQLHAEGLAHARDHLRREQRVPAEVEEVVVSTYGLAAQHLFPDPGQHLLGGSARRREDPSLQTRRLGGGQRLAIQLAVGGQRQRRELHPGGGHHVLRKAPPQQGAQVARQRLATGFFARHHVADQPALARRLLPRHHRRRRYV